VPILFTLILALLFSASPLRADSFPMQAKVVAPGVYAIITPSRDLPNPQNKGWNSNSGFVITNAGVLLFDSGSSAAIGSAIKSLIAKTTHQPVRWIINSHAHGDHWLGNHAFKDTVQAIYSSDITAQRITNNAQSWVERFKKMTAGASGDSAILSPDRLITKNTDLVFGSTKVSLLLSANSHSPGDIFLWLADRKVLIAGDVVYSDRMPSTRDSELQHWIPLLDQLIAMQPDVVIPGHGAVTDVAGLKRLRDLLQAFWDAVQHAYQADKTAAEMTAEVIAALAPFSQHYPGLAEKVRRDISQVYLQVEAASFR